MHPICGGMPSAWAVYAVGGKVVLDPAGFWTGWGPNGPVTTAPVWTLASTPAVRGSSAVADVIAPQGSTSARFASLPVSQPLPLPFGDVWIDPVLHVVGDSGVHTGSTLRSVVVPISTVFPPGERRRPHQPDRDGPALCTAAGGHVDRVDRR